MNQTCYLFSPQRLPLQKFKNNLINSTWKMSNLWYLRTQNGNASMLSILLIKSYSVKAKVKIIIYIHFLVLQKY